MLVWSEKSGVANPSVGFSVDFWQVFSVASCFWPCIVHAGIGSRLAAESFVWAAIRFGAAGAELWLGAGSKREGGLGVVSRSIASALLSAVSCVRLCFAKSTCAL